MSAIYEFPIDYKEPFTDPWYYPKKCTICNSEDFTWIDGKWYCSKCKEEILNE